MSPPPHLPPPPPLLLLLSLLLALSTAASAMPPPPPPGAPAAMVYTDADGHLVLQPGGPAPTLVVRAAALAVVYATRRVVFSTVLGFAVFIVHFEPD